MDIKELSSIIEAFLFLSEDPLTPNQLKTLINQKEEEKEETLAKSENSSDEEDILEEEDQSKVEEQLINQQQELDALVSVGEIKEALINIVESYQKEEHGIELIQVAKGYQFRSKVHLVPYLKKLYRIPKSKLSKPSLETLSIIAYQQPATRTKVEEVRGVDSGGVIKTLLEKDLIRIVGRSEEVGQPLLYGTTKTFLESFNLYSLSELPSLRDMESLDEHGTFGELKEAPLETIINPDEMQKLDYSEDDKELIGELENSLKNLKKIEKDIFTEEEEEGANPEEPTKNVEELKEASMD